ncbi:MAG TPA: ferritin-like domain-containing protein [Terriglobia bacterium]|nr:ferritin-like domain-containing protein [Terriglobia bacterium]
MGKDDEAIKLLDKVTNRRKFIKGAGAASLGAAAVTFVGARGIPLRAAVPAEDTVPQILTAALIAEDLATTFYYNGLIGPVIQDPNLAGTGGSATHVAPNGNLGNVNYIQAALSEEISHADLLRGLLAGPPGSAVPPASKDPVQTFYFPSGTFDTLAPFLKILEALENAFIGAYLTAVQEFALMASQATANPSSIPFRPRQLEYYAKVAASIMGIEAEHRVLGRVIGNNNPANNLCYEQTDGLTAVYNGPNSAVVALTPFLTSSTGPAYSFHAALQGAGSVSLPCSGGPPAP